MLKRLLDWLTQPKPLQIEVTDDRVIVKRGDLSISSTPRQSRLVIRISGDTIEVRGSD